MTGGETEDLELVAGGVEGSWDLDVFGRIRSGIGAARYAELAAVNALRDRELSYAAEVTQRYVEGLFRREQIRLRDDGSASQEAVAVYLKGRREAGLVREELLAEAEAERAEAAAEREEAAELAARLETRWAYLVPTNRVPSPLSMQTNLAAVPRPPEARTLYTLALRRPDVQAAYAVAMEADREASSASRSRLPELAAVALARGEGPSPAEEPEEWIAWAGVRLSLPVLAPAADAAAAVARDRSEGRAALYDEAVKAALAEIRDAYIHRLHTENRRVARQAEAARLRERLDSLGRQHEQGLIAVPEVERARQRWLRAEERSRALHAAVLQAHAALARACGGPAALQGLATSP
jgi:outer membrane protein TolC